MIPVGWLGRLYLLALLVGALAAGWWVADTYLLAGNASLALSLAAAAGVFIVLGWAFRRAAW